MLFWIIIILLLCGVPSVGFYHSGYYGGGIGLITALLIVLVVWLAGGFR